MKLPEGSQFLCKYDEIFCVFYVKTLATQVQYPEIAIKYSSWLMNGYFPPIWKIDSPQFGEQWRKHLRVAVSQSRAPTSISRPRFGSAPACEIANTFNRVQPATATLKNQVGPGRKRPGRGVQSAPQPPPFWWHARAQSTPGYGETLA